MSTFDSTKTHLGKLLEDICDGKIQLPDFQRGWVWDDDHIRELLVSVARSFPIGAVMLLETGGESRFQMRTVEGVEVQGKTDHLAEQLILDGQQRLTSLTQVLKLKKPVVTRDSKKRELRVHYYFDIEKALASPHDLDEAIFTVAEDRVVRSNFGRDVSLDLGSTEKEIAAFHFPCNQILDSSHWEYVLNGMQVPQRFHRFIEFRKRVLEPFRNYMLPVIALKRQTSKEAVCLVFEKVNTGGVALSVFELVTASWAAENFNLRADWLGVGEKQGRHQRLAKRALLRDLQPTDFLQALSLLHSNARRAKAVTEGRSGKELPAVSAKREHVLTTPLDAHKTWSEALTVGFERADQFLRSEGFHSPRFLPYRSQLAPLAAVMTHLGERWLEPKVRDKIARWFWCGVLGELYGGAVETRIALDFVQLLAWIEDPSAPEPVTVEGAGFQGNRLDTLRSRTSAAYRGLYVLLQREGAKDFFWKTRMIDLDREGTSIDIHHIFPKKWCVEQGMSARIFDSIVNKTAISYKANRMIGGKAPSLYIAQIQNHSQVQLADASMDEILITHLIDAARLRANDFEGFFGARKAQLLRLIERTMGKTIATTTESVADDAEVDDDSHEDDLDAADDANVVHA
ncbi:DUF262 domain-containing protein [soil metagenome]